MEFAWDPGKAKANARKHGVTFDEAMTVFDDPAARFRSDPEHSNAAEERGKVIGFSIQGRLLAVIFTERYETMRIISARRASAPEEETYAEARG